MPSSIKMRIETEAGVTTVRALIRHPMETGARKDPDTGDTIPEHYIKELVCEHNSSPVLSTYWGTGIAADPLVAFRIAGVRGGDAITVRWSDNRGRSDSLTVSA